MKGILALSFLFWASLLLGCTHISPRQFEGTWQDVNSGRIVQIQLKDDHSAIVQSDSKQDLGSWDVEGNSIAIVTEKYSLIGGKEDGDIVLFRYAHPVDNRSKPDVYLKGSE